MLDMGYDAPNGLHISQDTRKTKIYKPDSARVLQNEEIFMSQIAAGAVLDRMQKAVGVHTDIALSEYFGRGKSTAGGWRARNTVPLDECLILAKRKGVSLDWLLLGLGTMDGHTGHYEVSDGDASDARLQRMGQFISHWHATRSEDDKAWLEMQLARAVPEYAEWIATRRK